MGIQVSENNDIPGPGKFQACASESLANYLYEYSVEGFCNEQFGSVDEQGWFGLIKNLDVPNTEAHLMAEFSVDIRVDPHYVIIEDSQGFFTYTGYRDLDSVTKAWESLNSIYDTVHEMLSDYNEVTNE